MTPSAAGCAVRLSVLLALLAGGDVNTCSAQSTNTALFVDKAMSVRAGATVSTAVGEAVARAQEGFVPIRLFEERGAVRRGANIAYRLFRLAAFDLPQEQLLWVANHEVFGHGARLRERFDGPIDYGIDVPVPYGPGGGVTRFQFDREPTARELLAINVGGMEASQVAATLIADRAFTTGRMAPRDALRYLGFELDTFSYVRETGDEPEELGHDVSQFLETYNHVARAGEQRELAARTLRREVLVALANPVVGFAVHGIVRYIWTGKTDVRVPSIAIRGVRYLPLVRYRLTPYGTEWALVNAFAGRVPTTRVELRMGRAPGATPWGATVETEGIAIWRAWALDLGAALWNQPTDTARQQKFGTLVRARAERPVLPVWFASSRASMIVEIAAKSGGFVPGEPLGRGATVRVGVGLPLGR